MVSRNEDFLFANRAIGRWDVPAIEFRDSEREPLCLPIIGYIANSVPTSDRGKKKLNDWKPLIASEVKAARGGSSWDIEDIYAITLGFSFNITGGWHGYRPLDVENFIKPVIDAIAAGLFCGEQTDTHSITRWNFDDSKFMTLLIHRLPDARTPQEEGVAVCVSSKR